MNGIKTVCKSTIINFTVSALFYCSIDFIPINCTICLMLLLIYCNGSICALRVLFSIRVCVCADHGAVGGFHAFHILKLNLLEFI